MDRLELVALGDKTDEENMEDAIKNLNEFNINNAQCFDPNEERKLRVIMENIGTDRLKKGLKDIAKMLQDKINRNKSSRKYYDYLLALFTKGKLFSNG